MLLSYQIDQAWARSYVKADAHAHRGEAAEGVALESEQLVDAGVDAPSSASAGAAKGPRIFRPNAAALSPSNSAWPVLTYDSTPASGFARPGSSG